MAFAKAGRLESPAKSTKKGAKKKVVSMDGLEEYAEVCATIKALTAYKETLAATLKDEAFDRFVFLIASGEVTGHCSFRAGEGDAEASIEMRKRSSRSVFSESEVKLLNKVGVKPVKQVAVPFLLAFNPKYASNETYMRKAEKALKAAGLPEDIVVRQEEEFDYVATEDVVASVFKRVEDGKCPKEVIESVTTLAIKPVLPDPNLPALFEKFRKMAKKIEQACEEEEED